MAEQDHYLFHKTFVRAENTWLFW